MSKNTLHFHKDNLHTVQLISKVTLFNTSELIQCTGSCKCLLTMHFHKDVLHTVQLISKVALTITLVILYSVQAVVNVFSHCISIKMCYIMYNKFIQPHYLTPVSLYSVQEVANVFFHPAFL